MITALVLGAAVLAGCGGSSATTGTEAAGPKRAAEPADSPPLALTPYGRVAGVGNEPEGMVWDPAAGLVAVGLRDPAEIAFVDPRSLAVVRRVPLPAPPRHLAYDAVEGAVLVPAEAADALIAVRPSGLGFQAGVGTHPHDAAAIGRKVFVADEHSDQVTVVRGSRQPAELPAPHQPGGIAAVAGRWVALIAVSARVLQVYDAKTLKPRGRVAAGVGPSHIVADGDRAYVVDTQGERVLVFRIGLRPRLLATVPAPGTPYGLAVDLKRRRLWVTLTATNQVVEYSLAGPQPLRHATYATVRQPNSVAVEPRTGAVLVAGRTDGRLQRIEPPIGRPG